MAKQMPHVQSKLRHIVKVPECIYDVSGINVNGRRIKSLVFSTDVAVIANCNADAVIAVYPFTPTMQITKSIIEVAQNQFLQELVEEPHQDQESIILL